MRYLRTYVRRVRTHTRTLILCLLPSLPHPPEKEKEKKMYSSFYLFLIRHRIREILNLIFFPAKNIFF